MSSREQDSAIESPLMPPDRETPRQVLESRLPSFALLPHGKGTWIAASVLDSTEIAYWSGDEGVSVVCTERGRTVGRVSHVMAKQILARINADLGNGPFHYRMVDPLEWQLGAGFDEGPTGRTGMALMDDFGSEYEWCRKTVGDCIQVVTMGLNGPVTYQRHPLWPKGAIRLVRELSGPHDGEIRDDRGLRPTLS